MTTQNGGVPTSDGGASADDDGGVSTDGDASTGGDVADCSDGAAEDHPRADGGDGSKAERVRADGGTETADYLETEINLFKPATPFMRDHLRLVWTTFALWVLFVFGPVTAAALAPGVMTGTIVFGFQLHFLLTAIGAPLGALLLSVVYSWRRDALDEKYDIDHGTNATQPAEDSAAADGGEES